MKPLRHPLANDLLARAAVCTLFTLLSVNLFAEFLRTGHVTGLLLLVAGGVAYTLGALFFLLDNRVRYAHFVWHLFVLAGSTCHFFAALWHAA